MKNPFEKKSNTPLITGIVIGAVAAGAAAYLLLTEDGADLRQQITDHIRNWRETSGNNTSQDKQSTDKQAYMRHEGAKPKTDRDALQHNEILHHPGSEEDVQEQQS